MTVSDLINMLARYPGDYRVIHNLWPNLEDTLEQDFIIISPEEYEKAIDNGDIE